MHAFDIIADSLTTSLGQEVIEKGWGQRHGLGGSLVFKKAGLRLIPTTFTLLYAPRTDGEVKTVMEIVKAAIRFMTVRMSRLICAVVSDVSRKRLCRSETTYQTNGSFLGL